MQLPCEHLRRLSPWRCLPSFAHLPSNSHSPVACPVVPASTETAILGITMPDYVIHIGFISPPRRELSEGQGTFHMALSSQSPNTGGPIRVAGLKTAKGTEPGSSPPTASATLSKSLNHQGPHVKGKQ